jgi:hypothetical protein
VDENQRTEAHPQSPQPDGIKRAPPRRRYLRQQRKEGVVMMQMSLSTAFLAAALAQVGCAALDAAQRGPGMGEPLPPPTPGATDTSPSSVILNQDPKYAPLKSRFKVNDGYTDKSPSSLDPVFTPDLKGSKVKFCLDPSSSTDFMTPPDPPSPDNFQVAKDLRGTFQRWMKEGKIPADRYYFSATIALAGGTDIIFSVPAGDRDALRDNLRERMMCGWFDGNLQELPQRKPSVKTFHLPLSRWDGPLKSGTTPSGGDAAPAAASSSEGK